MKFERYLETELIISDLLAATKLIFFHLDNFFWLFLYNNMFLFFILRCFFGRKVCQVTALGESHPSKASLLDSD